MRPLERIKVIELGGLAPTPYCGMFLADFGADVVIVDRLITDTKMTSRFMAKNPFDRGKRSMRIDLKNEHGIAIMRRMISGGDVLLDPYRPGVMEDLGLGPEDVMEVNPALIYARLTGWGQSGPLARTAGHDINYIALSGALSLFRRKGEKPLPPCNLLGDFAGGGMLCTIGILLALLERATSGQGQVVDAAMLDGAASLSTLFYGLLANQLMSLDIGTNRLDGGAPFYQTYETFDGKYVAVGAIEDRFYAQLLEGLEIDPTSLPGQNDVENWPEIKLRFSQVLKTRRRDEWTAIFEGKDACVTPILELDEVAKHPHNRHRNLLVSIDGVLQPTPAPRLSRTPGSVAKGGGSRGSNTRDILVELGYTTGEIGCLLRRKIVA